MLKKIRNEELDKVLIELGLGEEEQEGDSINKLDTNYKILIVDDIMSVRAGIRKTLTTVGFKNVREASDGREAFNIIQNDSIDLVLCDFMMPIVDGAEFTKRMKASSRFKNIPIIMITVAAQKNDVLHAIKAGVDDYLLKPFTPDMLLDKLSNCISKLHTG